LANTVILHSHQLTSLAANTHTWHCTHTHVSGGLGKG
jgi:hypothetical protein